MSLSPMQARCVAEFLIDLNAAHAAIRAGYARKNAKQQGHALLQKAAVQEAVTEAIQARSERTKAGVRQPLTGRDYRGSMRIWPAPGRAPGHITRMGGDGRAEAAYP